MKSHLLVASGILAAAFAVASVTAQAKSMKECAAQWQEMKAANQTNGMKYRAFSKQCMSGEAATMPPATEAKPAPGPTPAGKPGRQAMIERERACGAEWKADKAAGKTPAGMKWPQYWSECNKRKKAEGM